MSKLEQMHYSVTELSTNTNFTRKAPATMLNIENVANNATLVDFLGGNAEVGLTYLLINL